MKSELTFYNRLESLQIFTLAFVSTLSVWYFCLQLGVQVLSRVYLFPSIIFTLFLLFILPRRNCYRWHKYLWLLMQIWSGLWALIFILSIFSGPFMIVAALLVPENWFKELNISPLIAIAIHILFLFLSDNMLAKFKSDLSSRF